jgi:transposase
MKDSIGIDVSKDHLDLYCLGDGRSARFGNDAAGFRKLKAWLPDAGASHAWFTKRPGLTMLPLSGALAVSCRWSR